MWLLYFNFLISAKITFLTECFFYPLNGKNVSVEPVAILSVFHVDTHDSKSESHRPARKPAALLAPQSLNQKYINDHIIGIKKNLP